MTHAGPRVTVIRPQVHVCMYNKVELTSLNPRDNQASRKGFTPIPLRRNAISILL